MSRRRKQQSNRREWLISDCELLLNRFRNTHSVRFQTFSSIWRETNFSHIFSETRGHEAREFSRLALEVASSFFLPPFSFQIRVGGLYLLYSLYQTQTASPPESIRLALKDWEEVKKFERDAMEAQHFDTVYILRRLMFLKAFHFTAMPTQLTFMKKRKMEQSTLCDDFMEEVSGPQELISGDMLEEMANVHNVYEKMKSSLFSTAQQNDSSVNLVQKDLVPRLRETATVFYQWQKTKTDAVKEVEEEDLGEGTSTQQGEKDESNRRAELLASIKNKAYGQATEAPKSRRHRQVELSSSSKAASRTGRVSTKLRSLRARTSDRVKGLGDLCKGDRKTTTIVKLTETQMFRKELMMRMTQEDIKQSPD